MRNSHLSYGNCESKKAREECGSETGVVLDCGCGKAQLQLMQLRVHEVWDPEATGEPSFINKRGFRDFYSEIPLRDAGRIKKARDKWWSPCYPEEGDIEAPQHCECARCVEGCSWCKDAWNCHFPEGPGNVGNLPWFLVKAIWAHLPFSSNFVRKHLSVMRDALK